MYFFFKKIIILNFLFITFKYVSDTQLILPGLNRHGHANNNNFNWGSVFHGNFKNFKVFKIGIFL